jgi:transposase-like protein
MSEAGLLDEGDYRVAHLRDQAASGVSAAEYCRRHGLCVATFYTWRRKIGRQDGAGVSQVLFTEIGRMSAPPMRWAAEVELVSGTVVRVSREADADLLRVLLDVVG